MHRTPVLFISHGAPTFAIEPGMLGPKLNKIGKKLSDIKTVLVISPHWQTNEPTITTSNVLKTIHDFSGFPAELYQLTYPAQGNPELAATIATRLTANGINLQQDAQRGLDHGAWIPLYHLLPQANIPILQLSLPKKMNAKNAFFLGKALAPLREIGVLIVASGSMTHNLYELQHPTSAPQPYAQAFCAWVDHAIQTHDSDALINYRQQAPFATQAHPTEEHFLPLLIALGAVEPNETAELIDNSMTYGVISMASYIWH